MRSLLLILASSLLAPPVSAADDPLETRALAVLVQIEGSLAENVRTGELGQVHNEDAFLYSALAALSRAGEGELRKKLETLVPALGRSVADLHAAADAFDRPLSLQRLQPAQRAFADVLAAFPPAAVERARELAARYTCPMHPDVVGPKDAECGKCGMPLDTIARVWLGAAPDLSKRATVSAKICTEKPLRVGEPADATLRLRSVLGEPLLLKDLREVHTEKIHLLVIDPTLTDYHHEHPVPTDRPGEYAFRFTPKRPGSYRAFADLQPLLTGFQEYAKADVAAPTVVEPTVVKAYPATGTHGPFQYELTFDPPKPKAGTPATGKVYVTKDGKPFKGLEPLMAAFAHLVGFHEAGDIVLHMHPAETRALTAEDRGGPELQFRFFADTPGFYRLFVQTQVDGKSQFLPFGVDVVP
jgi:hypothetical protein